MLSFVCVFRFVLSLWLFVLSLLWRQKKAFLFYVLVFSFSSTTRNPRVVVLTTTTSLDLTLLDQLGLQVRAGHKLDSVGQAVKEGLVLQRHATEVRHQSMNGTYIPGQGGRGLVERFRAPLVWKRILVTYVPLVPPWRGITQTCHPFDTLL